MDVYELAEAINRDFETLVKNFGYGTIDPLIKNVISALEALEALVKNREKDQSEIFDLKQFVSKFDDERRQRKNEKTALEKDIIELEDNYKKEINELYQAIHSMRTENLSIKNMVEISDDKHREEMLHQKRKLEEDFQSLIELKKKMISQDEQIRQLHRDIENYRCEVEGLQNNVEVLIRQNKELLRKNDSLQKHGKLLHFERRDLMSRLQRAEEDNLKLRKSHTGTTEKNIDSTEAAENVRFTLAELREVLDEKNELQSRLIELEDKLDTYRRASSAASDIESRSDASFVGTDSSLNEECLVYGPINKEPDEKLNPWKPRKHSGIRKFFQLLLKNTY